MREGRGGDNYREIRVRDSKSKYDLNVKWLGPPAIPGSAFLQQISTEYDNSLLRFFCGVEKIGILLVVLCCSFKHLL